MADVLNQSWLSQNRNRTYPIVPWATLQDTSGTFTVPNDFLVSLYLPVSAGLRFDPTQFFLMNLASFPAGYALTIGYAGVSPAVPVASASIAASVLNGQEFVPISLTGLGDFSDTVGQAVIGSTQGILLQPPGLFAFNLAAGQLDLDCIQTQVRAVTSIAINNGVNTFGPFSGDIVLTAGLNFELLYTGSGIQLNAISGAGLSGNCLCESNPSPGTPVTSINGIPASAANAFVLQGDDCLQVSALANGFSLKDLCSQPCCGPAELAALAAELSQFSSEVATLRQFVSQLQAVQATTNQSLLASKIGDQGCVSCS